MMKPGIEKCCGERSLLKKDEARKCSCCGKTGRPVSELTVKQQVKPEHLEAAVGEAYQFCGTPDCTVVYFVAGGRPFEQKDLRQRLV